MTKPDNSSGSPGCGRQEGYPSTPLREIVRHMSEPPSPRCCASPAALRGVFGALVRADPRRPRRLWRAPDLIRWRSCRRSHARVHQPHAQTAPGALRTHPGGDRHAGQLFGGLGQPFEHADPYRHVPGFSPAQHARRSERRASLLLSLSTSFALAVLAKAVSVAFDLRTRSRSSTSW